MVQSLYDYLKIHNGLKPISVECYYFDNHTFNFNPRYLYIGIVTSQYPVTIVSVSNYPQIIKGSSNVLIFSKIEGDFIFIGYKIEIDNPNSIDFTNPFVPFGDFNLDFSSDFSV